MADEFVPYPDMPGEPARSNAALAVDRSKAQWAKTFEGGTTNLATRARQSQDVKAYAENLEQRRMEESARRLATDKDAQNFYLRSKTLQLNEDKAYFDMEDKRKKADAAAQMAPLMFKAKEAQTNAQIANAARVAQQTESQSKITAAADLFHAKVAAAQAQYAPDSPEYERAIVEAGNSHAIARHDPAIQSQFMAAQKSLTARSATQEKTKAEADKRAADEKRAADAGLPLTRVSPAGDTFGTGSAARSVGKTEKQPDPELDQLKSKLSLALSNQRKEKLPSVTDAEKAKGKVGQSDYEPGIMELRKQIATREGGGTQATAANKPAMVRQNGVIYRLQPDGTYKE